MGKLQEAIDLEKAAEKKANSWSLMGGKEKYEDAADMYVKAANLYKMDKLCTSIAFGASLLPNSCFMP